MASGIWPQAWLAVRTGAEGKKMSQSLGFDVSIMEGNAFERVENQVSRMLHPNRNFGLVVSGLRDPSAGLKATF